MKHLYLFNEGSRGAIYGIGTYLKQLTEYCSFYDDISLNIINLHSDKKQFSIINKGKYTEYHIPNNCIYNSDKEEDTYYNSIWFLLIRIINHCRSENIIFHLNYYQEYHLIDLIKNKYSNCKIIYTIHYQEWCFLLKGNTSHFKRLIHSKTTNEYSTKILEWYKKEIHLFQKVDDIICLSQYTKRLIQQEYAISERKLHLVYNGIQDAYTKITQNEIALIKKQFLLPIKEKIILFVGRLEEIKGLEILIEAFKQVLITYPDSRLIIIGDGEYSKYLKVCRYYWSRIIFTGRLEKEDLYNFYKIADIGIMPSMHEQCSYVAIEMMMFNIPLIISTSTGLNEMMDDTKKIEINECFSDVHISASKLVLLIKEIFYEKNDKNKYRNEYLKKYTLKSMITNMNKIYNQI